MEKGLVKRIFATRYLFCERKDEMCMNAAKIDLHLHLDGSLYLPWAWKTAVKRGVVEKECTFEEYYSIFHRRNFKTREEGMKRFDFPIDVMQT